MRAEESLDKASFMEAVNYVYENREAFIKNMETVTDDTVGKIYEEILRIKIR